MYTDELLKSFREWNKLNDRDYRILFSFNRQIKAGSFLTENQAKLFLKILKENIINLALNDSELELIENPKWSKPFKINQYIRKIYIHPTMKEYFVVEFSYSKRIKNKLYELIKNNDEFIKDSPGRFFLTLNEKNLFSVIRTFKSEHFEIEDQLKEFYNEIIKIKQKKHNNYNVFFLQNEELKKS